MATLLGTWRFETLGGAGLPAEVRHAPWLTFDGDGQVYGLAGVNRVRGTWQLEGSRLTFGPVVSTLMAGPDEAMACERQVVELLNSALDVHADGDRLELRLDGSPGATLVRDDHAGDTPA
ncbi:META domain-containing protein [Cellulomonas fimi]|uniref:META domain-containing protein n=1 Tax=Cellulomonas fimi TaxID=1708 RepID=UPI00234CA8C1|nr:META domain-containing protein [Cellulomonas fimi]MDC7122924.1 META domain-containing protein [Cellulomonas fimi]